MSQSNPANSRLQLPSSTPFDPANDKGKPSAELANIENGHIILAGLAHTFVSLVLALLSGATCRMEGRLQYGYHGEKASRPCFTGPASELKNPDEAQNRHYPSSPTSYLPDRSTSRSADVGVPSSEPPTSDGRPPSSARAHRKIGHGKSNSNASSKGDSAPKKTTAGRLACDICRESKKLVGHYVSLLCKARSLTGWLGGRKGAM